MVHSELYRVVNDIWETDPDNHPLEIETQLVHDVLGGSYQSITPAYHIPSETTAEIDEIVVPERFELLNHSLVRDTANRFNVFVEATFETQLPVTPPNPRPVRPGDFQPVTVVYHLRAVLSPVIGNVQAKVFIAFEETDAG